ncbi:hypothetical protein HNR23_000968 [Nocardiopsis mwathae]|uniref:Uncharacterized protein n=1 Tax=Nocardiopsis mwathae TaxID=1472723 RepID=A0A7W9YEW8_9ACTN|nr:hypothetical protein [Nocardiopsis mwathae]MBB6170908.1 hypothetical protein [Nocardiopsis mwathae]
MNPLRPHGLPREVRARLDLARGERILAHAEAAEGTLVATTRALHLPDGHAARWEVIDRARWDENGLRFTEEGAGERTYTLDRPGRLAETVHERVTATILVSHHYSVTGDPDGLGFTLVARRPPGGSDIAWQVHLDEGVHPDDPRLTDLVPQALAVLRARTGV